MTKKAFFFLFFWAPFLFFGQKLEKKVLFTVNDEPIFVDGFKHLYLKNWGIIDDKLQTDIDTYLDLYIDYVLKLREAKALDLEKNPSFQREYQKYRAQLVNKYLMDSKVTESLIQEAYKRMQTAVNASHILIRVPANASPTDTLQAYQKIMEIREKIRSGENFEAMARKYSEDPSAKKNGGNLGWFSALKMVYPFETAAYNTPIGKISMPVRTQFGYHIIQINDKRPAKGKVRVAHIMLIDRKKDSASNSKQEIFEIYTTLQEGASFEKLAKKFSEDQSSAQRGGKLNPFAPGKMNAKKFEKIAFSLEEEGRISKPFQTKFGWHIIKLLEKQPIGSLEETRGTLENKIKNDSRARLINKSLLKELRKKYGIKKNRKALRFFQKHVDDRILKGTWEIDSSQIPKKTLLKIEEKEKTYIDFGTYLSKRQKRLSRERDKNQLIAEWLKDFTNHFILKYHKANLEKTNPEFAAVATEYYNGLLLFELMEQKIWSAGKKDRLGLQNYFENHTASYSSKNLEKIRGKVVSDYQKHLEAEWLKSLHEKYRVEINRKNFTELKKEFEEKYKK